MDAAKLNPILEKIKKAAEKKLDIDLKRLSETIKNQPLLEYEAEKDFPLLIHDSRDSSLPNLPKSKSPRMMFQYFTNSHPDDVVKRYDGSDFMKQLKQAWLPAYIQKETDRLYERFVSLEDKGIDLTDDQIVNLLNGRSTPSEEGE